MTGYAAWVFYRQEKFVVDRNAYPMIGKNPARLVVFFSRMGYVITYDLELLLDCCTDIIHLENGTIAEQHPVDEKGLESYYSQFNVI